VNRVTLLDFAIAASLAVVPVLLAVLLIVAWLRPQDAASRPMRDADHHVSAREVAALKTFERAIVRRDAVRAGPISAQALLAAVPACRAEWDAHPGAMSRVRVWLTRAGGFVSSPADRTAAQLTRLDEALASFSTADNRRVSDAVGFDLARWGDAVSQALREPAESAEYPGRKFSVQCSDIAAAVGVMTRSNARMLPALSWRGTEVPRVVGRWRPDQYVEISARNIARGNPWAGVPGCVYMSDGDSPFVPTHFVAEPRGLAQRLCGRPELRGTASDDAGEATGIAGEPAPDMPPDDPRWQVPPSLSAMLQALEPLHRANAAAGNRVRMNGTPIDVGQSIDVTIEPSLQALAQKVAACYTGRQELCRALGITRKEDASAAIGHRLLEGALVRMAAIAIIDVESGRIEALAGAMSPCTREEYDGPGRSAHCDKRMPYPIRYRPDALLNPAVFHDAMPGSVIKPIMATAFLTDPDVGRRWLASEHAEMQRTAWPTHDSLRGQLMRSDSARFLDRMFCADQKYANCKRPWEVQAAASDFGWNADCADAREDCGKRDLLFGGALALPGMNTAIPYGRLLVEPSSDTLGAPMRLSKPLALDPAKVAACAAGPDGHRGTKDDWDKCRARFVVDVAAEGWGQGNARSSALGVAGMMATLAAVANGDAPASPHLVAGVRPAGVDAVRWAPPRSQGPQRPALLTRDIAEVIMSGLSYSHRAGTARLACEQVFDARTCRDMDWIAGKTGTPTFPNDDVSLSQLAAICAPGAPRTRKEFATCGALRPYKWYVAAYRVDPDNPRWTKAIGVLTERNWLADTGRIHGAGDQGPNPAAEIAMQIAGRDAGYIAEAAK
jgi:cell division protein FtsI/penicillin-binding protein 2